MSNISPEEGPKRHPAGHVFSAFGVTVLSFVIVGSFFATAFFVRSVLNSGSLAAVISATLVDLANQDRQNQSLNTLTVNPVLVAAAQAKADDMAAKGYFAHVSPDGQDPWYWFKQAGYNYASAGENLAVNFNDSADVEDAWMNSPEHRANILSSKYTEIGIATAVGEYKGRKATFVVQEFGTPRTEITPVTIASSSPANPTTLAVATVATSTVLGAATNQTTVTTAAPVVIVPPPQPAGSMSAPSRYATFFERLLMSPQNMLRILYLFCGALVLIALMLSTEFELKKHHVRHVVAASFLILLMSGLLLTADHILFVDPVVSDAAVSVNAL